MHYVKFDNLNTYSDLNLLLSNYTIPPAEPKINLIEIEGRDAPIDASEATGKLAFNKRACSWEFTMLDDDYISKRQQVSNLLNGKFCKITMYDDPDYYYLGRLVVKNYDRQTTVNKIEITSDVYPYKLKQSETSVSWDFSETKNLIDIINDNDVDVSKRWKTINYPDGYSIKKNVLTLKFAGSDLYSPIFPIKSLTALSFSCETTEPYLRCYIRHYSATSDVQIGESSITLENGKKENVSFPSSVSRIRVHIYPNSNRAFPMIISNFQVEAGTSCTSFVPKGGFIAPNVRKPVVPLITLTNNSSVTINDVTANLSAGKHEILNFELAEGENVVLASGSGTITLNYQEGSL